MVTITSGKWWFVGNANNKFKLDKFVVNNFDDLKKIFKFSKQNWIIVVNNKVIKKFNYNFFIDGKRSTKNQVIKVLN